VPLFAPSSDAHHGAADLVGADATSMAWKKLCSAI
jgi:hypothetical protein